MRGSHFARSVPVAGLLVILLLSGCGSSSDPESWEEAEAQGSSDDEFPVKENFIESCQAANTGEAGFNEAAARSYCRCAFEEIRESLTFDEFDALDDGLRRNPDPNALEDLAADAWRRVEPLFEGCAADATA